MGFWGENDECSQSKGNCANFWEGGEHQIIVRGLLCPGVAVTEFPILVPQCPLRFYVKSVNVEEIIPSVIF